MHMQYLSETVVCKYSNCSMEFMLLKVLVFVALQIICIYTPGPNIEIVPHGASCQNFSRPCFTLYLT